MGKIILAMLIVLALIIAMPGNLASALNMEGTYRVYYMDEDGHLTEKDNDAVQAKKDKGFYAVSFKTDAFKLEKIKNALEFTQHFTQFIDGDEITYGYSPLIKGGLRIKGQLVNVQFAKKNGVLYIGSPLLIGWY